MTDSVEAGDVIATALAAAEASLPSLSIDSEWPDTWVTDRAAWFVKNALAIEGFTVVRPDPELRHRVNVAMAKEGYESYGLGSFTDLPAKEKQQWHHTIEHMIDAALVVLRGDQS